MGQCWSGPLQSIVNRISGVPTTMEDTHLVNEGRPTEYSPPTMREFKERRSGSSGNRSKTNFQGFFSRTTKKNLYIRQTDFEDIESLEMNDLHPSFIDPTMDSRRSRSNVNGQRLYISLNSKNCNDKMWTHSPSLDKTFRSRNPDKYQEQQPDVRQVAGLRNGLTCSVSSKPHLNKETCNGVKSHSKRCPTTSGASSANKYVDMDEYLGGGSSSSPYAYIVLNPRHLPSSWASPPTKIRGSTTGNDVINRGGTPNSSIDLEWEIDDSIVPSFAKVMPPITSSDTAEPSPPTSIQIHDLSCCSVVKDGGDSSCCSVAKYGSRASSQISIPGLDWDSQIDNSDLVSLQGNDPCLDPETEQLISEIERLTSQALQETNQWTATSQFGTGSTSTSGMVVSLAAVAGTNASVNDEENTRNNNDKIWTFAT